MVARNPSVRWCGGCEQVIEHITGTAWIDRMSVEVRMWPAPGSNALDSAPALRIVRPGDRYWAPEADAVRNTALFGALREADGKAHHEERGGLKFDGWSDRPGRSLDRRAAAQAQGRRYRHRRSIIISGCLRTRTGVG
jgi:hypothetical protein